MASGAAVTVATSLTYAGAFSEDATSTLWMVATDTLTLSGSAVLAGSISGPGAFAFSGGTQAINTGATISCASWAVTAGAVATLNENLAYAGVLTEGSGSSLALGASTLTLSGGGTALAGTVGGSGTLAFAGGSQSINTGAILSVGSWSITGGAAVTLNESLTYSGTFSEDAASTFTVAAGNTLSLNGVASFGGGLSEASGATITVGLGDTVTINGAATFAGTVNGTGILAFTGGTQAINGGATINPSTWSITAGVTSVNESLTFAGMFSDGAVVTIGSGDTFSLTGTGNFHAGAIVNGAGTMSIANAAIAGLTVGGTATLNDVGTVVQTGAVTVGDNTAAGASLTIASGATWNIAGDVGLARGKSTGSGIAVTGTLIKTAGTGKSVVSLKVVDSGLIEVAAGTLDFTQAVTGKGALKIDASATLELDNTVAKTTTTTFAGSGARLDLKKASKMAGTIAGFMAGDTIDLLKTSVTSVSLNGSDQLVVMNGASTVATLQLAGNYAGQTFGVVSDGHGGSAITVSGGGMTSAFIAAMAAMGVTGAPMTARIPPIASSNPFLITPH